MPILIHNFSILLIYSNVVQLILSILLLRSDQIDVLKVSIIGTILSNLLLATGLSFLLGSRNGPHQYFTLDLARMICQLLLLSVQTLTITTFFYGHIAESTYSQSAIQNKVLPLSRGISVLVLILYALWLVYSSRPTLYERYQGLSQDRPTQSETIDGRAVGFSQPTDTMDPDAQTRRTNDDNQGNETCLFSTSGSVIIMILSITLLAFNTLYTTDSIQGLLLRRHVSQTFLSLIILPLLSVDPMSISMAMKDRMDMSILLTVERCMQTSLLIAPLTVIIGSCMGSRRMDLHFDSFSLVALFLSVILVIHVMQGGKSNW
jgi:Ca2+:H+ antiporter